MIQRLIRKSKAERGEDPLKTGAEGAKRRDPARGGELLHLVLDLGWAVLQLCGIRRRAGARLAGQWRASLREALSEHRSLLLNYG